MSGPATRRPRLLILSDESGSLSTTDPYAQFDRQG
jgi:hypothetical protein